MKNERPVKQMRIENSATEKTNAARAEYTREAREVRYADAVAEGGLFE